MTRFLAFVAVMVTVPAFAQDTPAIKAAKELNGIYTVKSANFDSQPAPKELLEEIKEVEIKDGKITVRSLKNDDPAKFTVDPTKKPASIDIKTDGETVTKPGIYRFEKGELTIAFSDKDTRPADFGPAQGVRVLVLTKKVEPKKEEPKKEEPKKDDK